MSTEMHVILDIIFLALSLFFAMEVKSGWGRAFWSFLTTACVFFLITDLIKVSNTL